MLWAIGLQRLETVLHGDRPSAGQIVTRLEHAARSAREKAAQRTLNELSGVAPRFESAHLLLADEPGLPTRPLPIGHRGPRPANPQVRPSQLADRV